MFVLTTQQSFASSAAGSMNTTGVASGVNAGTNASYGSRNAARCSGRNPGACIRAMLGYAQMGLSLLQMLNTMRSRDGLSPGTDWGINVPDIDYGAITGVDRDRLDPILDAIESGTLTGYENANNKLNDLSKSDLQKLKDLGYSFDAENGTVTTPAGTQSLDSLANSINDNSIAALTDKINSALGLNGLGDGAGGSKTAAEMQADADFDRSLASVDEFSKGGVDKFLKDLDKGKLDSKLTGMSVNTKNGDAIGVAMGNLFKTIHVKYKSLDSKEEFK